MTEPSERSVIVPFPGPREGQAKASTAPRNLGLTLLSEALGPVALSPKGHWCDRCQGIWYSHFGEARCPVCGGKC
jgi:hypothetical protein